MVHDHLLQKLLWWFVTRSWAVSDAVGCALRSHTMDVSAPCSLSDKEVVRYEFAEFRNSTGLVEL